MSSLASACYVPTFGSSGLRCGVEHVASAESIENYALRDLLHVVGRTSGATKEITSHIHQIVLVFRASADRMCN